MPETNLFVPHGSGPAPEFDREFWRKVNDTLDALLDLEPADQESLLDSMRKTDPTLHAELERLLARAKLAGAPPALDTVPGIAATDPAPFQRLLAHALSEPEPPEPRTYLPHERIGAWKLLSQIGAGGMGEVWLAERADGLFRAKAAVKFLRPDGDPARFITRFAQERELLARLNHPGIARMLDAGFHDGAPYLVLEYVEGRPLLDHVRAHRLGVRERMDLIRQIGEALVHAHAQLVVHRDIKPSNVLVTPEGKVKLLDFGVAGLLNESDPLTVSESPATRLSGRGLTVEYAAPEQILGQSTGVASDIYSLSALAYHLCAGHRAHLAERGNRAALEHEVLHTIPMRVSVAAHTSPAIEAADHIEPPHDAELLRGDVDAIIAQGMRRDPAARYVSMSDLVQDIERWLKHLPIAVRRQDRRYRARLWLRRNWIAATLSTALLLALCLGFGVALWQAERAKAESHRASMAAAYLIELLNGADPDVHGGQWPTVLALIEQARAEVPLRFRNDPAVEYQISQHLATVLRRLSRFQDALPLARRSMELAEQQFGPEAEPTRAAKVLLADILYWLDETPAGLSLLETVVRHGAASPHARWWREAILLHANMLGELRRFEESYRTFDRYLELIRGLPEENWLRAEAEVDRALIYGRQGRLREAYDLHRRYRAQFENPPAHARRVALNALMNTAHFQLRLGIPEGVEATLQGVVAAWDRLAGRLNRHSLEALEELGLYYLRFGSADAALKIYAERAARAEAMSPVDTTLLLRSRLDELEVKLKRALQPLQAIRSELLQLEEKIQQDGKLPASLRLRLQRRLAHLHAALGDARPIHAWLLASPPPAAPGARPELSPSEISVRYAMDAVARALANDWQGACESVGRALTSRQNLDADYTMAELSLRQALYCTMADHPLAAILREQARAAIPKGLPAEHRLRRIQAYVEFLAESSKPISERAAEVARLLGVPSEHIVHPSIPGLWL